MSEASAKSSQVTLLDTLNVTGSQDLADGDMLPGSQDGQTNAHCGLEVPPVSHGVLPGRDEVKQTSDIFGQNSSGSPVPAGRLSSWESRLRTRLEKAGGMKWPAIWKASTTPAGRSLSRHAALARLSAGTGYGLWPSPAARDHRAPNNPNGASRLTRPATSGKQLPNQIVEHLGGTTDSPAGQTGSLGWLSPELASWLMGYPTEWISLAPSATQLSLKSRPKS